MLSPTVDGNEMHSMLSELFPLCRSLSGDGNRQTLKILQDVIPLKIKFWPSGKKVFDWVVPDEWEIEEAYIKSESGDLILSFADSNLHVVSYSTPIDTWISLSDLESHLHSFESQPDAIPYVTSYYNRTWGFCLPHRTRMKLKPGLYHVVIKSKLFPGVLNYGELVIPGKSSSEILISTYICHPSMANNELSGPVVASYLARLLQSTGHFFTYRFLFLPETIGSLAYMSENLTHLKKFTHCGFVLTCIGDEGPFSVVHSPKGNNLADKTANFVLKEFFSEKQKHYSFMDRGSDERQYCSTNADLPVVTLCRSKFGEYPEYHTSLDNLDFVTPKGLKGGLNYVSACVWLLEKNMYIVPKCVGEPQLSKRNLYPTISIKGGRPASTKLLLDVLAYSCGNTDIMKLCNILERRFSEILEAVEQLVEHGLAEKHLTSKG